MRSGRSIEIVLNEQSKRKTPALVSLESNHKISSENVRNISIRIGVSASSVLNRNSSSVIRNFPDILGKSLTPELQEHLNKRLLDFKMDDTKINGIEPHIALALILSQYVKYAQHQLQEHIDDAIIAVPSFFTNVQRSRISLSAKLAGLNLIKIIDQRHALALVYAIEKTSFFTREPRNVAIIDFGHGSLNVNGYKFSSKVIAHKGHNPKPVPKIEDINYDWDDTIGGINFDVKISRYLSEVYSVPMTSQLLQDSQRLKHALTLNDKANISMDSIGKRIIFTRAQFNEICRPLFEHIKNFLLAVNQSYDSIELVGGASRIPFFNDIVSSVFGNISHSLNADESIVVGTAYSAAMSSGSFKLMDINYNPTSSHSANLTTATKTFRLFSKGSSLSKLKTARIDTDNVSKVLLSYDSKIPIGCNPIIGEWEIMEKDFPNVSRIALSFGFNAKSKIILSKSILHIKNVFDGEISQKQLKVQRTLKPLQIDSNEKEFERKLVNAIESNEKRIEKIAKARNNLESIVFELKNSINNDQIWQKVTSESEKLNLTETVKKSEEFLETHHDFENETILNLKAKEIEEEIKPIRFRVQESRTRETSCQELQKLLDEMQDAVLKKWPKMNLHVPRQQKKAILNHVKLTKDWLNRKMEEQNELDPWDEPALKTGDITIRIKKLGEAFRNLEDAVKNRKAKGSSGNSDENEYGADL
ncbi:dnaK protein [Histomonas meleagridis]|uniref:dnaK protein n=1 Tax=Histomonas meleagridis TaxID=135588 RepID=UPI00355AB1B2|nr:dnaK protein [Histomonas meleagridis]KAH0800281.1 dnaK protein [Histomonas meleagridis]